MQTKIHGTIRLAFSEETVQLVIKQRVLSLSRFSNSKQLLSISCKRIHGCGIKILLPKLLKVSSNML